MLVKSGNFQACCSDNYMRQLQEGRSESKTESEVETEAQPEGELRVEAEQKTGMEDALVSPTAAAKFEQPPSETEVRPRQCSIFLYLLLWQA